MFRYKMLLIVIVIILTAFTLTGCGENQAANPLTGKKASPQTEAPVADSVSVTSVVSEQEVNNEQEEIKEAEKNNSEKAGNIAILTVVYDKEHQFELPYQDGLTPQMLIQGLSDILGVKIEVNKAEIKSDRIIVDFSPNSAPIAAPPAFDDSFRFRFTNVNSYIYCVLDSIMTTLNKNLGSDKEIYFSVNGRSCIFQNLTPPLTISPEVPYKGYKYYRANPNAR